MKFQSLLVGKSKYLVNVTDVTHKVKPRSPVWKSPSVARRYLSGQAGDSARMTTSSRGALGCCPG